jgi:hypothetical protein
MLVTNILWRNLLRIRFVYLANAVIPLANCHQFHLLVVCIFLNKTRGDVAIPKARALFRQYSTPEILAIANSDEIKPYFKGLGLPARAQRLIDLANAWLKNPPKSINEVGNLDRNPTISPKFLISLASAVLRVIVGGYFARNSFTKMLDTTYL